MPSEFFNNKNKTKKFLSFNINIILIMIILQINLISIKCDERWYLYKYSKLYNSYKFDIANQDDIEEPSHKNCIDKLVESNKLTFIEIKNCGKNLITEEAFNILKQTKDFKNPEDHKLLCLPGYKTLEGSYLACNYKEKSKIVAVCLEIFGLGIGHLYLQNYLFFFVKFLLSYLFCYMIVGVIFFVGALSESNVSIDTQKRSKKIVKWILPVYCLIYFSDMITILIGIRKDANGQDLSG